MSSAISGFDLVLEVQRHGFSPRLILDVVLDFWPEGVFQDAEEENTRPLSTVFAAEPDLRTREFFIYRDEASARSWNKDGRTDASTNSMLHFLIVDQQPDEGLQVTMVCDELTPELANLYGELGVALRKRPLRVDFDKELQAVGCSLTRAQLYELVEGLSRTLYPEWSPDELACHPHDALQFCKIVRAKAKAHLPDYIILKALLNRRKQR